MSGNAEQKAVQVAEEARDGLTHHVIECSDRYYKLDGKVEKQGVKLDNLANDVGSIKSGLNSLTRNIEERQESLNSKIIQGLGALLALALSIIGFFLSHDLFGK
jgi:predicted  nucleic acid-binding Zn-ribbon protein